MIRDPLAALDAAHHLLWLAADDNPGAPGAPSCASLHAAADKAQSALPEITDRARVLGYLTAAADLLNLADADAADAGLSEAMRRKVARLATRVGEMVEAVGAAP